MGAIARHTQVMGQARRKQAGLVLLMLAWSAGCADDEAPGPLPGAGVGLVKLAPAPLPEPGVTITLTVSSSAPPDAIGGICVSLDRWRDGAWEARWNLPHSTVAREISDDEPMTCPAIGRTLPTELTVTLPRSLEAGTWRLGYGWITPVPESSGDTPSQTVASYVFEVP